MNTPAFTATKVISNTKLAIATFAMFGAGAIALATVPANFWSGAVDPDAKTTFDQNQLFIKSTTKYNGGSKTDYCYTFPTGKTYLMEGISNNGNFQTWQKNCAELNVGKPTNNYQCVEGACVNVPKQNLRTLVCLMRWHEFDPELPLDTVKTVMGNVNNYFKEVSFGNLNLDIKYSGNNIWNGPLPTTSEEEALDALESCGGDLNNLDLLVMSPPILGSYAWGSELNLQTSNTTKLLKVAHLFDFLDGAVAHEIGHTLKLSHAEAFECGIDSFGENCLTILQGNPYDNMGPANLGHFNGWIKNFLEWSLKKEVKNSGSYKIGALEVPSIYPQVMRIPFTSSSVCLDYRKPIGKDDYLTRSNQSDDPFWKEMFKLRTLPKEGALFIYLCNKDSTYTKLIDTTPNNTPYSEYFSTFSIPPDLDFVNAYLPINKVFQNDKLGITVSFTASSDLSQNYANVNLTIDPGKIFEASSN